MNIPRDESGAVDWAVLVGNIKSELDVEWGIPIFDDEAILKAIYNAAIDDAAGVVESVWDPESIKDALEELKQ